jgi:hypothetical protein
MMATKEISVKRYVVRLSVEEREQLEALIRKGKSAAHRLLKARILLKADVSEAGEGWSDNRIIKATAHCVSTGEACMRHCLGVLSMKDTSMAGCTNSSY